MAAFITIGHENNIQVELNDVWESFPLSLEGCQMVARFLVSKRVESWGYSSSVDHVDEYDTIFDRNVGDVIEEEVEKI